MIAAFASALDGQTVPVVYGGKSLRAGGTLTARRVAALIRLRDLARRVLQSQNDGLARKTEERCPAGSQLGL